MNAFASESSSRSQRAPFRVVKNEGGEKIWRKFYVQKIHTAVSLRGLTYLTTRISRPPTIYRISSLTSTDYRNTLETTRIKLINDCTLEWRSFLPCSIILCSRRTILVEMLVIGIIKWRRSGGFRVL